MPDHFQDYSHFSHPSPSGSSDAQSSNGDAPSTTSSSVGFTEWTRDYDLDALYSSEFMVEMTEDELMEYFANIPAEALLPEPQTIPPYLLQGFRPAQNAQHLTSSSSAQMMAQPNVSNVPHAPFNAANTWSPGPSHQFFASPQQQVPPPSRQLPPSHPAVTPTSPNSQASSSSSVGPPGDSQRLSLPAPGDMNYSACEVIM
ncbi:unnamed protein product [Rhizoctonia solani]|uniref:Uncharacterized protein n=1 Tax=Rhizoctonia solani AG-3 Rhs1AP TaxID=1086054 RepID=X8JJU5_9AGAM|nr:hypothetical protein RSOL_433010 [Rhizoctonia solani AG-3 Rhs1AP]CAE6453979.1 unnamed protein product [Rhizoctonia solani]